jgi:hypothetical protein
MRFAIVVCVVLVACKSKPKDAAPEPAGSNAPAKADDKPAKHAGLAITHSVPEFSGTYDKVLAQLARGDEPTTIAFVRGCPALTCETGAWEPEQVAHVCPKAYIATVKITGDQPGKFHATMSFAGPAENASTATLDDVRVELTALGTGGVAGSVSNKTTESSVDGSFTADVCPRT